MPRRRLRFFALRGGLAASPALLPAPAWEETAPGVFAAESAGWRFVVSAARARLIHAAPIGRENILLVGGHRAWLAPQLEWPVFWPPPSDWEASPAAALGRAPGDERTLLLVHSHADRFFPALIRRYTLRPDGLLMTLAWPDDASAPGRFQALQILQLRTDARVTLTPRPTPEAPLGHGLLALATRPHVRVDAPLPDGFAVPAPPPIDATDATRAVATGAAGSALTFCFNGREEKFGFPPQPVFVRMADDGTSFRLVPMAAVGEPLAPVPEAGLTTQLYFGAAEWPLVEIEQLSPRLRAHPPATEVSATFLLEVRNP